jgi:hypothetical protein
MYKGLLKENNIQKGVACYSSSIPLLVKDLFNDAKEQSLDKEKVSVEIYPAIEDATEKDIVEIFTYDKLEGV